MTVTARNVGAADANNDPETSFDVTVTPNNAPARVAGAKTTIEVLSKGLTVGESVTVALDDYFSDADGDALRYELVDVSGVEQDSIMYPQESSPKVLTATITDADPSATPPTVATPDPDQ